MLHFRISGIVTLTNVVMLAAMPLWFMLAVVLAVELTGGLGYWQIDFRLYVMSILVARLLTFKDRRDLPLMGPLRERWLEAIGTTNRENLILAFVMIGAIFLFKDRAISRKFVIAFLSTTWLAGVFLNRYLPYFLARTFFRGAHRMRTLFYGQAEELSVFGPDMDRHSAWGLTWVGRIGPTAGNDVEIIPWLGEADRLREMVINHSINQIVVGSQGLTPAVGQKLSELSRQEGCRILILDPCKHFFGERLTIVGQGGLTFFTLGEEPLQNPLNRLLKRALDVAVALPVCLFILPLLTVAIAIGHGLQSPGPLLILQKRGGREKLPFTIYKFRSMHVAAADGADRVKNGGLPPDRLFPMGRFLRRSSLDEMPQFANVLLGQMSIVGPRPHLISDDRLFSKIVETYRTRHFVKPGITGLAQQRGFRGEIKTEEEINERIRLDLQYIRSWSIWLDLGIMVKTALHVFIPPERAR